MDQRQTAGVIVRLLRRLESRIPSIEEGALIPRGLSISRGKGRFALFFRFADKHRVSLHCVELEAVYHCRIGSSKRVMLEYNTWKQAL